MKLIVLSAILQGVPYLSFERPPLEAPVFVYWTTPGIWGNTAAEPASLSVPADIDMRDYLNERRVCVDNDAPCRVYLRYRLTLDARDPSEATRAVVQYIIAGSNGTRHEGCAWLDMDRTNRRQFIRTGDAWQEKRRGSYATVERKMVNLILVTGVRRLEQESP